MSGENPTPQDPEVNPADVEAALNAASPTPSEPAGESAAIPPRNQDVPDEAVAPAMDDAEQAAAIMAAADEESNSAGGGSFPAMPLDLPMFAGATEGAVDSKIGLLSDVELDVKIELGRAAMLIEEVLRLGEGSVVELDKLAGDPVDVLVNDRLVARGEVLVLNDNFCVRISEILPGNDAEAA
ncbi:MAG: flagellar motor switch protein FliN [Planctomycetes bacterium]|nr:flagellar motor switch protein FliN [Planctomycetota bacterium]